MFKGHIITDQVTFPFGVSWTEGYDLVPAKRKRNQRGRVKMLKIPVKLFLFQFLIFGISLTVRK